MAKLVHLADRAATCMGIHHIVLLAHCSVKKLCVQAGDALELLCRSMQGKSESGLPASWPEKSVAGEVADAYYGCVSTQSAEITTITVAFVSFCHCQAVRNAIVQEAMT